MLPLGSPLGPRPSPPHSGGTPALLFRLPEFSAGVKVPPRDALIGGGKDVRRKTRATAADTRDAAFLGRYAGWRIAPAALQRLRQGVFPAAAVLPRLRRARCRGVRRERQGPALQLCDPPPPGSGLHATLCDRRRRARGGAADDDQHHPMPADPGGVAARHAGRNRLRETGRRDHPAPLPPSPELTAMQPKSIAIVGAAETTDLGVIPNMSQIQLHADAALNAMADAGLKPADIDGIATAGETPVTVAHYLGLTPKWVDGTAVGGCSFMIHVRHAAAAIASGLCETVLITHGESGRSGVGRTRNVVAPTSLAGQFEQPYGPMGPPTLFTIPVLRYMKTYGLTHEQLAMVAVVQREWAAKNPRATFKDPITVVDVLSSRMIAYPFRLLQCCLVTDGGGALILTTADRAKDFPTKPVYLLGTGESVALPMG